MNPILANTAQHAPLPEDAMTGPPSGSLFTALTEAERFASVDSDYQHMIPEIYSRLSRIESLLLRLIMKDGKIMREASS